MKLTKDLTGQVEFLITFALCTVAGLLAFLLVWIIGVISGFYPSC